MTGADIGAAESIEFRVSEFRRTMADDDIGSPQAIAEMNRRHLRLALAMQEIASVGLAELRERGDLTAEVCAELLDAAMKLEIAAGPGGSRKRH